jgi:hypothetical protein
MGRLRIENTHRPDSARICSNPLTHASSPAAKALSFVTAVFSRCQTVGAGTLSKFAMPVHKNLVKKNCSVPMPFGDSACIVDMQVVGDSSDSSDGTQF